MKHIIDFDEYALDLLSRALKLGHHLVSVTLEKEGPAHVLTLMEPSEAARFTATFHDNPHKEIINSMRDLRETLKKKGFNEEESKLLSAAFHFPYTVAPKVIDYFANREKYKDRIRKVVKEELLRWGLGFRKRTAVVTSSKVVEKIAKQMGMKIIHKPDQWVYIDYPKGHYAELKKFLEKKLSSSRGVLIIGAGSDPSYFPENIASEKEVLATDITEKVAEAWKSIGAKFEKKDILAALYEFLNSEHDTVVLTSVLNNLSYEDPFRAKAAVRLLRKAIKKGKRVLTGDPSFINPREKLLAYVWSVTDEQRRAILSSLAEARVLTFYKDLAPYLRDKRVVFVGERPYVMFYFEDIWGRPWRLLRRLKR